VRERLLNYIRRHSLMQPGDRVGVAVSGGADSLALLRLLLDARAELGIVLSVIHFNHRIRGAEAEADEQFVRRLAQALDLEYHGDSADTPAYAAAHKLSLEAAGRQLRYRFFDRLTTEFSMQRVATAHTRDDQAETVLMRFLRGSGTKGLAGIHPKFPFSSFQSPGEAKAEDRTLEAGSCVVRPLLEVGRAELRAYLEQLGQAWREDQSNADVSFARNRLRHQVLPVLCGLNPALDETLAQTAEIARAEEDFWRQQVRSLLPRLWVSSASSSADRAVNVPALRSQPVALQRRLIRALAEQHGVRLEFQHVEQVLTLAAEHSAGIARVELPHGWEAVRRNQELCMQCRCQTEEVQGAYDVLLTVPGEVELPRKRLRASLVSCGKENEASADHALLNSALSSKQLQVRNWRAGDRYWPANTRQPKKVKELLQARHIPREQQPSWPVVVSGRDIVWVPGFAAPERFRPAESDSEALLLEEIGCPSQD
jgi:tRNA(Ile)-lysidine synthase